MLFIRFVNKRLWLYAALSLTFVTEVLYQLQVTHRITNNAFEKQVHSKSKSLKFLFDNIETFFLCGAWAALLPHSSEITADAH
jgi:hypothetical protein